MTKHRHPPDVVGRPARESATRRGTEVPLRHRAAGRTLGPVTATDRRPAGRVARIVMAAAVAASLLGGNTASATAELLRPVAERHGDCSDRSDWRLTVRHGPPGVWRLRLEIATGRPDQRWTIFLSRNGVLFFSGSRLSDQHGDVLTRVGGDNGPGMDRFRFGAHDRATGETCQGAIVVDRTD